MSERSVLIQYVVNQRGERPTGLLIWSDGLVQRCADDNPLPGISDLLEQDRVLKWQDDRQLGADRVEAIRAAIRDTGFFKLPPHLLINYCAEDPSTAIWTINLDGQTARVIVYDPRPKRSAALDNLLERLNAALA